MSDLPFDGEMDDESSNEDVSDSPAESQTLSDVRKWGRAQERKAKAAEKELEDLRAFRAEVVHERRQQTMSSVFTEVGLPTEHIELFTAVHPDIAPEEITKEKAAEFAAKYRLTTTSNEEVEAPAQSEGFTPITTGTGGSSGTLSPETVSELLREGRFEDVNRAYQEGRVQRIQHDAGGSPVVDWIGDLR